MNYRTYLAVVAVTLAAAAIWLMNLPAQFPYSCERRGEVKVMR